MRAAFESGSGRDLGGDCRRFRELYFYRKLVGGPFSDGRTKFHVSHKILMSRIRFDIHKIAQQKKIVVSLCRRVVSFSTKFGN